MKTPLRNLLCLTTLTACLFVATAQAEEGFVDLFDGETLNGWVQHGGEAKFEVREGMIVGISALRTGNSFLCTEKDYGDFILELEFKVDPSLNSGIQIRSEVFDEETTYTATDGKSIRIPAGRVHGYQVEIDPSPRAWSAGIYDEGRRGWLYDLKEKPKAREAFKQNEWNQVKVECRGASIKTWLNGVEAADLQDNATLSGFIALQVHGIGNDQAKAGKEILWKNIRIKELK